MPKGPKMRKIQKKPMETKKIKNVGKSENS